MSTDCLIRVFYPRTNGRIVLHTALGWDTEIEAVRVEENGTRWDFVVSTDEPYF